MSDTYRWDIDDQSALIGALVTVAMVVGMLLRRRRRKTDLLFSIFATNLTLWFAASCLNGYYEGAWVRAELAVAALIPASLLALCSNLVRGTATAARRLSMIAYPISAIIAIVGATQLGEINFVQIGTAIYISVMALLTSRVMMQSTHVRTGTVEYARLRYLAIGVAATTTISVIARWPGTVFSAAADLGVMIYVFFLSQIILRDRLLDLYEFFGRMLVFGVLTLLFASISGVMIFAFPAEGSGETFNKLFNTLISIIIVLTLYDPIRERLDAKAIELFFRERRGFPQVLDQLRRTMLRVLDPGRMSKLVLDTLYDERRCTHAAIYLLEEPLGRSFRLEAYRGPTPTPRINERQMPALWHAVQQNKAAILVEQLIRGPDDSKDSTAKQDLIEAMRAASADVLLPFLAGDRVLGFLALRDDRVAEAYSTEEIALLMNIADTAVIVLENSHLARRLTERDRLAAIGEMAAGLAHEVRNPLGAIKGAAQYLEPGSKNGDEAELLQVIVDESNRLNGVVSQFLDYARPFRAQFSQTDLNEVVKKTVKLVRAKQDLDAAEVVFDLDEQLEAIEVDAEQIKQVILNLILNGVEASDGSDAPVKVSTRYIPERERIEIRVRDHGPGIPRDALPHIFVPFFTTKQNGTGLGLAVCQRIITNHGGDIRVQSQRKEGTTFIIRLPLRRRHDSSITGGQLSKTPPPRPSSLAPLTSDMPLAPAPEPTSTEG